MPLQTAMFSAVSTSSLALEPAIDDGKGPRPSGRAPYVQEALARGRLGEHLDHWHLRRRDEAAPVMLPVFQASAGRPTTAATWLRLGVSPRGAVGWDVRPCRNGANRHLSVGCVAPPENR